MGASWKRLVVPARDRVAMAELRLTRSNANRVVDAILASVDSVITVNGVPVDVMWAGCPRRARDAGAILLRTKSGGERWVPAGTVVGVR